MVRIRAWACLVVCAAGAFPVSTQVWAQTPDHPVITEVFQDPAAGGGPAGRDPADPHQEFLEIYLPPLADLDPALDADSLALTLYEVEGDSSSANLALVNYRIDLPAFDLDPSNGLTGLARPASGVVVVGWVDYLGNPPTALAGTPTTRVALIGGGVTATAGFSFIALNGAQFTGTTNFPVPDAISHLDTVLDPAAGIIEQGSSVYLLVDRDDPGYASLCGSDDPGPCNSFPNLPAGNVLGVSSLLDAFAGNDDPDFDVEQQPYAPPTGDNIDHEFVLPLGGAFSSITPQVPELANGYQRLFADLVKTSEDGVAGNEDPVADALGAYWHVANVGPFRPTPGYVPFTTSGARLELADDALQSFQVLTGTNARPGLVAANLGGDFGMDFTTAPAGPGTPGVMTVAAATSSSAALGQVTVAPQVEIDTAAGAPAGHAETLAIQVNATKAAPTDPALTQSTGTATATFTATDPTTGLDALGQPFQATALVAVHGLPDQPGVANEIAGTSFAAFAAPRLGVSVFDVRGNGAALLDPATDLTDPILIDPMIATMPTDPLEFINWPGATQDLVTTVLQSAETAVVGSYDDSFDAGQTLLQARRFNIQETATRGGGFVPGERIHYTDAAGLPGEPSSGLSEVLTGRDFELVLVDTQLGPTGVIETSATDDFGLVVEVGRTRAGASVVPGELVFLSLSGGLEGADIDTLDVPPHGNLVSLVYVDLDALDDVLGAETITRVFAVDGSGGGEVDIIEVFALPEPSSAVGLGLGSALLAGLWRRRRRPFREKGRAACDA